MASWFSYTVLPAVSLVVLGLLFARCEVAFADDCKCQDALADPVKTPFDPCTSAGFFRSNTTLRPSTVANGKPTLPYDYYQCVPYGATFIRYTQRCSPDYIFYKDKTAGADPREKYLNAFDNVSKRCSTTLPPNSEIFVCTPPTTKCP